jgi:hypothetical protein
MISALAAKPSAVPKVKVKYRHPTNPSLVWSSRESQPAWVKAHLDGGGSMDELKA